MSNRYFFPVSFSDVPYAFKSINNQCDPDNDKSEEMGFIENLFINKYTQQELQRWCDVL